VAPKLTLAPNMMLIVFLYAMAAATLGGYDSPVGAIVGGIVVGLAESMSATYVPFVGSDMKLVVAIVVVNLVLLVRPSGLLGSPVVHRV
jgi:branched-chain amino acid transport system permease protein